MTNDLPSGWSNVRLDELCDFNPKHPKNTRRDIEVSFVPMPAVDVTGKLLPHGTKVLSEVWNGYTHFANEDVLFAKITPCMENGKIAVARNLVNGIGCGTTEFHVLRSRGAILPEFLQLYLRQLSFRADAERAMTGAVGQRRVPAEFLKSTEIPLPPLEEQEGILRKIESLTVRRKAVEEEIARIPWLLNRYRREILFCAFRGELTRTWRESGERDLLTSSQLHKLLSSCQNDNHLLGEEIGKKNRVASNLAELRVPDMDGLPDIPSCWTWAYLPSIGYMSRGKSKHRPRNAAHLYGGPFPFIQTGDIANSNGLIQEHQQTYSEAGLSQSRLWPTGTVCITIAANIACSAVLSYPACFPDSVVGVIVNPKLCLPEYVEYFVRTAREDLERFAPATAQKNINVSILSDVALPLPSIEEQHVIVLKLRSILRALDLLEEHVIKIGSKCERLENLLLAKAFAGKLSINHQDLELTAVTA